MIGQASFNRVWTEAGPITTTDRMSVEQVREVEASASATVADPVPLGLTAFGFTAAFFGCVYLFTRTPLAGAAAVIPVAIAFGGLIQLLACMWAMRKGNTFTATFLGVFSGMWLCYYGLARVGAAGLPQGATIEGIFWLLWGIVAASMFIPATRVSVPWALTLGALALTCGSITIASWGAFPIWLHVAGALALLTGISAFYAAFAEMVNSVMLREAMPLGTLR